MVTQTQAIRGREVAQRFFADWPLWEKLCFVLACLIIITITAGICKMIYKARMMRKYNRVATDAAQTPGMLETQKIDTADQDETVPFGIRALERGIEVEGVWVSQGNTPVPGSPASMASSLNDNTKSPTSWFISESTPIPSLYLPEPVQSVPTLPSIGPILGDRSLDRRMQSVRAEPSHGPWMPKRRHSVDTHSSSPGLPPIELHLDNVAGVSPADDTRHSIDITEATDQSSEKIVVTESENPENKEKLDLHPTRKARSKTLDLNDPRADLDLLLSHRLSHVAETGVLRPRVRRPGFGTQRSSRATYSGLSRANFVERSQTSPPIESFNSFATPKRSWSSSSVSTPVSNRIFTEFGEISTPSTVLSSISPFTMTSSPLSSSSPLNAMDYGYHTVPEPSIQRRTGENNRSRPRPVRALTVPKQNSRPIFDTPQKDNPPAQPSSFAVTNSEQYRASQVLRRVNDGFEILQPGTLNASAPKPDDDSNVEERPPAKKLRKKSFSDSSRRFVMPTEFRNGIEWG